MVEHHLRLWAEMSGITHFRWSETVLLVGKLPGLSSLWKQSGTLERVPDLRLRMERKTGFEPATLTLAKSMVIDICEFADQRLCRSARARAFVDMPFTTPKCPSFLIEVARKWHDMYVHLHFSRTAGGPYTRLTRRRGPQRRTLGQR